MPKDVHASLRRSLLRCNLCELERLSGVPNRTLRRIRNGSGGVQEATIAAISPHFEAAQAAKVKPKALAAKAAATRRLNSSAS